MLMSAFDIVEVLNELESAQTQVEAEEIVQILSDNMPEGTPDEIDEAIFLIVEECQKKALKLHVEGHHDAARCIQEFCLLALDNIPESKSSAQKFIVIQNIAFGFEQANRHSECLHFTEKALDMLNSQWLCSHEHTDIRRAQIISIQACVYMRLGDMKKTQELIVTALDSINAIPWSSEHFEVYDRYRDILGYNGYVKEALRLAQILKTKSSLMSDVSGKTPCFSASIGFYYFELGKFVKAAEALEQFLDETSQSELNQKNHKSDALCSLIHAYFMLGEFKKAMRTINRLEEFQGHAAVVRKMKRACKNKDIRIPKRTYEEARVELEKRRKRAEKSDLKLYQSKWLRKSIAKEKECAVCFAKDVKLFECGRCAAIHYCGKEHQKVHWKIHKHVCKK